MANYNKQFNFRNGVQVDDDNLVVNAVGLVGIGTTIPTENLDVRGNAKISGFSSATSTFTELLTVNDSAGIGTINLGTELIGAGVSIRNGIVTAADSNTGIVTFYGDARFLQGMPTPVPNPAKVVSVTPPICKVNLGSSVATPTNPLLYILVNPKPASISIHCDVGIP